MAAAAGTSGSIAQFGPFRLDLEQRLLFRGSEPLHLAPKIIDLLSILVGEPERVVSKSRLMSSVWPDVTVEEGNLTKGIHTLRRTLGARPDGGEWIETVAKRGYRLASAVTREATVPAPEIASGREQSVTNPDARRAYSDGRYLLTRRPGPAVERALACFQRAVQLDPRFAEAWAALGEVNAMLGSWESGLRPPLEAMAEAHRHSARAISLQPELADAHATLGYATLHYDWDTEAAGRSFRRALELNPMHARAHHWQAHAHAAAGRFQEAERSSRLALEADPLDLILKVHYAWHHLMARDANSALEESNAVIELEPGYHWGHYFAGWAYEELGEIGRAVDARRRAVELTAEDRVMRSGYALSLARAGDRRDALAVMDGVMREVPDAGRFAYESALVHLTLGERDEALQKLEVALESRSPWMVYLSSDARLDPLRSAPRFVALQKSTTTP